MMVRMASVSRPVDFPSEAEVPETLLHFELRTALYLILKHALAFRASVGSDQFVYWNAKDPRRCLAPDVFVKLERPHERFDSWKTWERGVPELAVEILSENEEWPEKLARYAELGVSELVSYAPEKARIRVWDRLEDRLVERVVVGTHTPCCTLGLHWCVGTDQALRLAHDGDGTSLLPTPEEAALRRVAELEALLKKQ